MSRHSYAFAPCECRFSRVGRDHLGQLRKSYRLRSVGLVSRTATAVRAEHRPFLAVRMMTPIGRPQPRSSRFESHGRSIPRFGSIFGASEESNAAPTSFRYSVLACSQSLAVCRPRSVSLAESAEVCFTACSWAKRQAAAVCPTAVS